MACVLLSFRSRLNQGQLRPGHAGRMRVCPVPLTSRAFLVGFSRDGCENQWFGSRRFVTVNMPSSFYEAVLQGLAGDVTGRRSLFLFAIEHSAAMMHPFGSSGQTRLATVVGQLGDMVREMAQADTGGYLDVGLVGYGTAEGRGVSSLWESEQPTSSPFVRSLHGLDLAGSRTHVRTPAVSSQVNGYAKAAMDTIGEVVHDWKTNNPKRIFEPVVLHITAGDGEGRNRIAEAVQGRSADPDSYFFNCCLVNNCPNSVVVPDESAVPAGFCRELHASSSDMPPLMEDVGALLRGNVTPRMRDAAANLARSRGLPSFVGSIGIDLLGGALGRGGVSVPTGLFSSRRVGVAVEGLTIDSCRGFVLVRDRVGFRVFTRLCN